MTITKTGARHSKKDLERVQQMHDDAVLLGGGAKPDGRHGRADFERVQTLHETAVELGAVCKCAGFKLAPSRDFNKLDRDRGLRKRALTFDDVRDELIAEEQRRGLVRMHELLSALRGDDSSLQKVNLSRALHPVGGRPSAVTKPPRWRGYP